MNAIGSVLLDTTIVVDHLRSKSPSLIERFKETATLYLPVIALGELLYGAYKSALPSKSLGQIEDFGRLCAVLGIDAQTSVYYGQLNSDLGRLGKLIPQNDIWIAAIALQHSLPLATRDQHFSFVPGLTLLEW
jgi:tRNA(fMet)-specific endonuclease VapC